MAGLMREARTRFAITTTCGNNRSQHLAGKSGCAPSRVDLKSPFNVCLDCSLGGIVSVHTSGHNLNLEFMISEMFNQLLGNFIIKANQPCFESLASKLIVHGSERRNVVLGGARSDGDCIDVIGIIAIKNEDILVTSLGCDWIPSSEVDADEALEFGGII